MTMSPLAPDACPDCGTILAEHRFDQLALLKHAGYGAAMRTVLRRCSECGWSLTAERGEVRP